MFLGAHGSADVANEDGYFVGFVILDETDLAAKNQLQAIQSLPEGKLEDRGGRHSALITSESRLN